MSENVVRRPFFTWLSTVMGVAFYACAMGAAVFMRDDGYAPPLVVATFVVFLWMTGWHSAIRFTDSHLIVTNIVVTSTVAWSGVARITADDGLCIRLRDERELGSIAFGGSLIGAFTGYPTYEKALRILCKAHKKARRGGKWDGTVQLRRSVRWRQLCAAAALIYGPLLIVLAVSG
ncbi:hypothetical protein [Streptomyces marianii]|uniref:PH domain-containing protein n=1 Tax=Streptomyces marianii TaxID=1817406 RepID=A0A5R9E5V7_9ACTN|nr:hypothetical protein [Streptomyces marianii]TLQ45368.1 hypothetical protein FEF34_22185 [Streptomyces marianii]